MSDERKITGGGFSRLLQRICVKVTLCTCNALFATLEAVTRFRPSSKTPSNILIVRTGALGDFLLAIPAMQRLRQAYPDAKLTLLTTATTDRAMLKAVTAYANQGSPWLSLLPDKLIDEIRPFELDSYRDLISRKGKLALNKKYDVCFILNEGFGLTLGGTAKKIIFLRLIGIGCRIYGIRMRACPKIFPAVQRGARRLEHHVLAIMRSVEEHPHVASTPLPVVYFGIQPSAAAKNWMKVIRETLEADGSKLIVVAPGSKLEFKRWPVACYAELVTELLKDPKITVVLVGSGPELETARLVEAQYAATAKSPRILHNLAGQPSIDQLTALLEQAAVFVGNDGGTCHLAAAAGCKVVSIANGAEYPDSVEPWGSQRFTARFDVPCAPCYSFTFCPKGNNRCVTGIDPHIVLGLVTKALYENGRHP